jgi:hypothetical protein
LLRDLTATMSGDERAAFQSGVRAATTERPDVSLIEHMLDVAVAIEAERG